MVKMNSAKVGLLAFAAVLMFYWSVWNATGLGWTSWFRLAKFGRTAVATITGVQPDIHRRCSFRFTVDAVEHHGQGDGCSRLGVGAELPVTYLPDDPSIFSTVKPGRELMGEIFGPLGPAAFAGVLFAWRFNGRRRSKQT